MRPRKALDEATNVVSPKADRVRGLHFTHWGDELSADVPLADAEPGVFDRFCGPPE